MQAKKQKSTKEQRIALLEECIASGLKVREYAALKNVAYSTLTRWASQLGVSLAKAPSPRFNETPGAKGNPHNNQEGFSFINLTGQIKEATAGFGPLFFPHQASQEDTSPCGLEIWMPNGVTLKVDQVPFGALWPQVIQLVRAFT